MNRLHGVLGAGAKGSSNSAAGNKSAAGNQNNGSSSSSVIKQFVKDNPDFMHLDASQRNALLLEVKLQAKQKEIMMRGSRGNNGEMSESYKHTIEKMMEKRFQKRKVEIMQIKPVWFNGGHIDKRGVIYDEKGLKVGKIDQVSRDIILDGNKYGKYHTKGAPLGIIKRFVRDHNKKTYGNNDAQNSSNWFFGNNDAQKDPWW